MYVWCEFGLFYGAKSKLIESLFSPRLLLVTVEMLLDRNDRVR